MTVCCIAGGYLGGGIENVQEQICLDCSVSLSVSEKVKDKKIILRLRLEDVIVLRKVSG